MFRKYGRIPPCVVTWTHEQTVLKQIQDPTTNNFQFTI